MNKLQIRTENSRKLVHAETFCPQRLTFRLRKARVKPRKSKAWFNFLKKSRNFARVPRGTLIEKTEQQINTSEQHD